MRDAEVCERFQEARRGELRAVVGGQRQVGCAAGGRRPCEHRLFHGGQRVFPAAALRQVPAYDFAQRSITLTR
jgi:hypothetical protein